jgi:1-deoxy-D-xylulose-5-phosphate reductoisomerase
LKLAYDVLMADAPAASCVLNAANEVAVAAFLAKRIGFTDIAALVDAALQRHGSAQVDQIESVLDLDEQVRATAQVWVRNHHRILPD